MHLTKRSTIFITAALVLAWIGLSVAYAQESRGTILGTVTDGTGAVVPDAEVLVANMATGTTVQAVTNANGNFRAPYLTPAVYTVRVKKAGFKQFVRSGVELRVADTLNLPVTLDLEGVSETVSVTAEAPLLQSAEASLGTVIDRVRLQELPIRDGSPAELAVLSPGVSNATDLRQRKAPFTNGLSQITTNGGQQYGNDFTIDGIPNTSGNRIAFSPPTEAVQEFKVQTSTYDASQGHTPGAVINMVTRNGTNQIHGEGHEWFRNKALDANQFFNNMAGIGKNNYKDNRFGASAGGPVFLPKLYDGRNKSFWFFAFEDNPSSQPIQATYTVPTDLERKGDFSELLALGGNYQIYDPFSIVQDGSHFRRTPFPGNVIPSSRLDPVAQNLLKYYPEPNQPAQTADGRGNFRSVTPLAYNRYRTYTGRFDHNFSDNHRMFGRFSLDKWEEEKDNAYGNIATGGLQQRMNRVVALDDVLVLSSNLVLNLRAGVTRQLNPMQQRSTGKVDYKALGFSEELASLIPSSAAGFPTIGVAGYGGFGGSSFRVLVNEVDSFGGTLSWTRGRHNLRFGPEFRAYKQNGRNAIRDVSPQLTFNTNYTKGPIESSTAQPIGGGLAAFLLGVPSSGSMSVTNGYTDLSTWLGLFVHDDWKVSQRLTLNLGFRYELDNPLTERYNRMVNGFDTTTPLSIAAQAEAAYAQNPIAEVAVSDFQIRGGYQYAGTGSSGRGLWQRDNHNLMPRIGLAYQVNQKTVVRGGYGIYFDTLGVIRVTPNQPGFSQTTSLVATLDSGQHYLASLANPFPNGLIPPVGNKLGVNRDAGQGIYVGYLGARNPYTQNWSFGIQRELPGKFVLETSYVGSRAVALPVDRNLNPIPRQYLSTSATRDQANLDYLLEQVPNPMAGLLPGSWMNGDMIDRQQLLKPYPQFDSITATTTAGMSWYHAWQTKFERRMSHGFTLSGAYTWSKTMDGNSYRNETDPIPEHVIDWADPGHSFNLNGIYELPFGKGRHWGSAWHGVVNHILGGWQIGGLFRAQGGQPQWISNAILLPGHSMREAVLPKDQRSWQQWFGYTPFNTTWDDQPDWNSLRTLSTQFGYLRGPGYWVLDTNLNKKFTINERFALQFRGEAYNVTNHTNLGQWTGLNPADPGSSTIDYTNGYPRNIQLALRLMF